MVLIYEHCTINAKIERSLKIHLKDIKIHLRKDNLLSLTTPN